MTLFPEDQFHPAQPPRVALDGDPRKVLDRDGVALFHGDARVALRTAIQIDPRTVVITDPVWPNGERAFPGFDAVPVFRDVVRLAAAGRCARLVVILGVQSDPRFLRVVPPELPFLRSIYLRLPVPHHNGRVLAGGDVAYVFGAPPATSHIRVIPGEVDACRNGTRFPTAHPCPRREEHMMKLVEWLVAPGEVVLDPFAGSGTTLAAARAYRHPAIGVELEKRWVAEAVRRLEEPPLFAATRQDKANARAHPAREMFPGWDPS